jgi:hypothetical protein
VVAKLDRFSRNLFDCLQVSQQLQKRGVNPRGVVNGIGGSRRSIMATNVARSDCAISSGSEIRISTR